MIHNKLLRLLVILFVTFHALHVRADQAVLKRCLNSFGEYQDLRITGTATRYVNGKIADEIPFTFNIGRSANGEAPPYEVGHRIPNPGEPHLDEAEIFVEAIGEVGQLGLHFERKLISKLNSTRRSTMLMSAHAPHHDLSRVSNALFGSVDGFFSRACWGIDDAAIKRMKLKVVGEETFLGHECKRIQLTLAADTTPPVVIESLVAMEPTVQVVRILSTTGGPPGYSERMQNLYAARKPQSMKVFERWLFCDRVRLETADGYVSVEIDDVEQLPASYRGIWDYNSLSGVDFLGKAERATRPGSGRLASSASSEVTYIPFTAREQTLIWQYTLIGGTPIRPTMKLAWMVLGLLSLTLCLVVWRMVGKLRGKELELPQ